MNFVWKYFVLSILIVAFSESSKGPDEDGKVTEKTIVNTGHANASSPGRPTTPNIKAPTTRTPQEIPNTISTSKSAVPSEAPTAKNTVPTTKQPRPTTTATKNDKDLAQKPETRGKTIGKGDTPTEPQTTPKLPATSKTTTSSQPHSSTELHPTKASKTPKHPTTIKAPTITKPPATKKSLPQNTEHATTKLPATVRAAATTAMPSSVEANCALYEQLRGHWLSSLWTNVTVDQNSITLHDQSQLYCHKILDNGDIIFRQSETNPNQPDLSLFTCMGFSIPDGKSYVFVQVKTAFESSTGTPMKQRNTKTSDKELARELCSSHVISGYLFKREHLKTPSLECSKAVHGVFSKKNKSPQCPNGAFLASCDQSNMAISHTNCDGAYENYKCIASSERGITLYQDSTKGDDHLQYSCMTVKTKDNRVADVLHRDGGCGGTWSRVKDIRQEEKNFTITQIAECDGQGGNNSQNIARIMSAKQHLQNVPSSTPDSDQGKPQSVPSTTPNPGTGETPNKPRPTPKPGTGETPNMPRPTPNHGKEETPNVPNPTQNTRTDKPKNVGIGDPHKGRGQLANVLGNTSPLKRPPPRRIPTRLPGTRDKPKGEDSEGKENKKKETGKGAKGVAAGLVFSGVLLVAMTTLSTSLMF